MRVSGFGITDSCELPFGCWELNTDLLDEVPMLLTTEPSLQPNLFLLKRKEGWGEQVLGQLSPEQAVRTDLRAGPRSLSFAEVANCQELGASLSCLVVNSKSTWATE